MDDDIYASLEHDYRLAGFQAATERIEDNFLHATLSDDMFVSMADHHTEDGRNSYLLFHDRAAAWNVPGQAELVALHIVRDPDQRSFDFDIQRAPVVPLAQNWLIQRGCPPQATVPTRNRGPQPADSLTSRLEDQLRTNSDGRYEVLDDFTENPSTFDFGTEVRTLVYDHHPDSTSAPYRLFLEETDKNFQRYTVREGAFPTAEAADDWVMNRASPFPLAPTPASSSASRADAARARSVAQSPVRLAVPPAAITPPRPPSATASRPRGGAR